MACLTRLELNRIAGPSRFARSRKAAVMVRNFTEDTSGTPATTPANVLEARAWIAAWKEKKGAATVTASTVAENAAPAAPKPAPAPPAPPKNPFNPVKTYPDGTIVFTSEQLQKYK